MILARKWPLRDASVKDIVYFGLGTFIRGVHPAADSDIVIGAILSEHYVGLLSTCHICKLRTTLQNSIEYC